MIKNVDLYDYVVKHGDFRELLILLGRFYADRIASKVLPISIPEWKDSSSLKDVYIKEIKYFMYGGTGTDAADNFEDWFYDICRSYDAEYRYESFHDMCYNLSVGDFVEEYDELVDEKVRNLSIDPNHDLEEERKRCLMQMVKNNRSLLD